MTLQFPLSFLLKWLFTIFLFVNIKLQRQNDATRWRTRLTHIAKYYLTCLMFVRYYCSFGFFLVFIFVGQGRSIFNVAFHFISFHVSTTLDKIDCKLICKLNSCRFYEECKRRYTIKLWKTFTDCFNCLPVAAIGKYFKA